MSPDARHSHSAVTIDAMQGMLFIFGGYGFDGVPANPGGPANADMLDVWVLDFPAKGWEKVLFEGTCAADPAYCALPATPPACFVYADAQCQAHKINCQVGVKVVY